MLLILPACEARSLGSLKTITHPYIAQYECYEATLGDDNILDNYDYIRIILADMEELNIEYKLKNGERRVVQGKYEFNQDTRELTADIGIFGYKYKHSVNIINGRFTISKPIGTTQLIMKFQAI